MDTKDERHGMTADDREYLEGWERGAFSFIYRYIHFGKTATLECLKDNVRVFQRKKPRSPFYDGYEDAWLSSAS